MLDNKGSEYIGLMVVTFKKITGSIHYIRYQL